ncbi:hypothetical protein FB45DRAFT_924274 [Roridomyces roridus]|uniref:GH16 domain-containing protein n=1 Tax=Roridomyces roridus TaxID=1738132 RepID=A0AAD7BLV9_9AGAR|nr:hypothetical protein FB45DRAFT_924274 [Roridomyces roridus]
MPSLRSLAILAAALSAARAQTYTLSQDLSGANFFSAFKYNESAVDFNNFGNVHFLGEDDANNAKLTFVDSNNRAIIKVDNTTNGAGDPTFGRNTVYLMSNKLMTIGSLLIFDANHMPFGCSVWPSLFTQGQVWPAQGEIDIIENVNLATNNRFSLHVGDDNCVQPTSVSGNQTGQISTANGDISNCTVTPATGQNTIGCVTSETKDNSFGQGFSSAGGGVFAALWDESGIAMWFFSRPDVPSNIGGTAAPDPTTWGKASAWYPASGCNPSTAFGPQIITLYIDICGAFAGQQSVFEQSCASAAPNCSALVGDPANYNDAYWEINYLRVFTNSANVADTSSASSGPTSGGSAGTGSQSGSSPSASQTGSSGALPSLPLSASLLTAALVLVGMLSL